MNSPIIVLSEDDRNNIIHMYGIHKVKEIQLIDSSRDQEDLRFVYCVTYQDANIEPIVVKVSSNSFTTHERIHGWAQLTIRYT